MDIGCKRGIYMAAYKDETRHHRMSWLLLKPHLKSKYQTNSGRYFVVDLVLPKGYQMDMFASLSASSISSDIRPLSCINCVDLCEWLFIYIGSNECQ